MICLSPGVIYSEVTIDTPQGSGEYITIRNANLNFLPPAGVRISPLYAPNLPILDGEYRLCEVSEENTIYFVTDSFQDLGSASLASILYLYKTRLSPSFRRLVPPTILLWTYATRSTAHPNPERTQ